MARGRPAICPYCGSNNGSINKGFRETKTMGRRRIKLCKACGRKLTPRNQKPTDAIEEKLAETCVESSEGTEPGSVSELEKSDESASDPEVPPEPDENSGIVSSPEEEWTS
ncbi:hypothetical protein LCGC14_2992710 [marine sediment metagenome]|uniref:Uncharacterized protein n=1 Tax=marine sediment metagenome TaxID=412755 RepID=A0A0F8ZAU7_9ZZZZ